jgi:hypothetical protein
VCVSLDIASENYLFSPSDGSGDEQKRWRSENIYFVRDTLICFFRFDEFFYDANVVMKLLKRHRNGFLLHNGKQNDAFEDYEIIARSGSTNFRN